MARLIVRRATQQDILDISGRLRRSDQEEIRAISNMTMEQAVAGSAAASNEVLVMTVKNKVISIIGVTPLDSSVGSGAYIWQLGTDEISDNMISFYKETKRLIQRWLDTYGLLQNWVYAENLVSIRYIKKIGCTLAAEPMAFGAYGNPFYHFYIRGERHVY